MTNKFIGILLILQSFFIKAQTQINSSISPEIGIYAGIGLTNAFENNSINRLPRFTNVPFKFVSKPSLELGIQYTIPIVSSLIYFKSELGIITGQYVHNASINGGYQQISYDSHFEALSYRSIAELNLPLASDSEFLLFGFGPALNFTSSDSMTEMIVDSYNVGNFKYSNKFNLGAKVFIGLSKKNSAIKFNYNYVKLNSQSIDIPFAPFNSSHFKVRGKTLLFLYLISLRPLIYWPVSDFGCFAIILGVPSATT